MPGQDRNPFAAKSTAQRHAHKRRSDELGRPNQGHNSRDIGERGTRTIPYAGHDKIKQIVDLRDLIRRADPQVSELRASQFKRGSQLSVARVHDRVRRGNGDYSGQRDAVRSTKPGGNSNGLVARPAQTSSRGEAQPSLGIARVPAASAKGGRSRLDAASCPAASGSAPRPNMAPRSESADCRGALEDGTHLSSERNSGTSRALSGFGRDGDPLARYRDKKDRGTSCESLTVGGRRAVSFACALAFAEREAVDVDTAWDQLVSAARFEGVDNEGLPICICSGLVPEIVVTLAEVTTPLPREGESAVDRAMAQFKRAALRSDFAIEQSIVVNTSLMPHEELWESTEMESSDRLAARQLTQLIMEGNSNKGSDSVSLLRFEPVQANSEGIARLVHIQRTVRVLQRNDVIVHDWVSPLVVQTLAGDRNKLVPILALDAVDAQILTGIYVVQMACLGHLQFREHMIDVLVDALCDPISHERILWRVLACVSTLLSRSSLETDQHPLPGVSQLLCETTMSDSVRLWVKTMQSQLLLILGTTAPSCEKMEDVDRLLSCMWQESTTSPATPLDAHTNEMSPTSRPSTPESWIFPVSQDRRCMVRKSMRDFAVVAIGHFPPLMPRDRSVCCFNQFVLLGGAFPVPTDLIPKESERVFMRAFVSPLIGSRYIDTSECKDESCVDSCKQLLRTIAKLCEVFPYKVNVNNKTKAPLSLNTFRRLNTRNGSAIDRPLYETSKGKKRKTMTLIDGF